MNDTEGELSRVFHDLPPLRVDPQVLATVHRRIARRRAARLTAASAAVVLVAGGVVAGVLTAPGPGPRTRVQAPNPTTSAGRAVVGWVDHPAPAPSAPTPTTAPTAEYPACAKRQLRASAPRGGPAGGHVFLRVWLTNDSSRPCTLSGPPAASYAVHPDGSQTTLTPSPGSSRSRGTGANLIGPGPANLAPGQRGGITAAFPDNCAPSNPANQVSAIVVVLPGGGALRATLARRLAPACPGGTFSAFGAPVAPGPAETSPLNGLGASVHAPATVAAGRTLGYTVTLANTSNHEITLDPCPSYTEVLEPTGPASPAAVHSSTYYLNCPAAPAIPPGGSVSFAMRMAVPSARTGSAKLDWQLNTSQVAAATVVGVTASGPRKSALHRHPHEPSAGTHPGP